MNSLNRKLLRTFFRYMPNSIAARTTLSILVLSMLLGLAFAAVAAWRVEAREQQRAESRLTDLLSTVESTARIACYLNDRSLASEVASGLFRNEGVEGVTILAGGVVLHEKLRPPQAAHQATTPSADRDQIRRAIYSPFNASERVGEIRLYVDRAQIHAQARAYSAGAAMLLAVQVAFVSAGVAFFVFGLVTRPIRDFSNALHRLKLHSGGTLSVPANNRHDEIGQLVGDVNSLVTSLTRLLGEEHTLRVEHEVNERRMRLIFEKSETGMFLIGSDGALQSWNPAFARILKKEGDPRLKGGTTIQELMAPHSHGLTELIARVGSSATAGECDIELPGKPGTASAWVEVSVNPISPGVLQGVLNDITARKQTELDARQLAAHDALTGLLNRHGLDSRLASVFGAAQPATPITVLQIDLDFFKQVNDAYGHAAGDRVLQHVAHVLEHCVRRMDLIARPGGDEFVVALIGIDDEKKARQIGESIVHGVSQPIALGNGHEAHIGASVGIASGTVGSIAPETLLARADVAMYAAKQAGRGRVRLDHDPLPATVAGAAA